MEEGKRLVVIGCLWGMDGCEVKGVWVGDVVLEIWGGLSYIVGVGGNYECICKG